MLPSLTQSQDYKVEADNRFEDKHGRTFQPVVVSAIARVNLMTMHAQQTAQRGS